MADNNCNNYVPSIQQHEGTNGIVTFSEDGRIATKMMDVYNKNIDGELNFSALREISFLKQFYSIPHIPHVYSINEQTDKFIIVMNNCGMTLLDFINHSNYTTRMEHFNTIFIDVITALINIHANYILHGDIKSANICYNPNLKQASIIDFGSVGIKIGNKYNKTLYTFDHLAPEIILKNHIDEKSEVWALGIIMVNFIHKSIITHMLVNHESNNFYRDLSTAYNEIDSGKRRWIDIEDLDIDDNPKLGKLIISMLSFEPTNRPKLQNILFDYFGATTIPILIGVDDGSQKKDPNIFNKCKKIGIDSRNKQIEKIYSVLKSLYSLDIFSYVIELLDKYINLNPFIGNKRYDIISASCIHIVMNIVDQTNPTSYKTIFNKFNLSFSIDEINHFETHICNILSYKMIYNLFDKIDQSEIDYDRVKQIIKNYNWVCLGSKYMRDKYTQEIKLELDNKHNTINNTTTKNINTITKI